MTIIEKFKEKPIYRFRDMLLDVSQIWYLFQDITGHVYANGIRIARSVSKKDYTDLEKKFFNYRGCNYDR